MKHLPGSERYTQREPVMAPTANADLITRANLQVSIFDVLEEDFGIYHPREGGAFKGYCPFGFEHPDGGVDKGWRTYPVTNSSYCFVQHGVLSPVRLMQLKHDEKAITAARRLLGRYGLLRPRFYQERFNEILLTREVQSRSVGDVSYLVEALNMALRRLPAYERRQYDADVIEAFEAELEQLDTILANKAEADEVRTWYQTARDRLTLVVERVH